MSRKKQSEKPQSSAQVSDDGEEVDESNTAYTKNQKVCFQYDSSL